MYWIYQSLLKEVNGGNKYLGFPYLLDNNFEVMCTAIALDKIYLVCTDTVREKYTVNDAGFITYSNKIYFSCYWLDNCGYLMNEW